MVAESRDEEPSEREVVLARFRYRHEAELAAGFLLDAGIPYRLQIDDAGGVDFGTTFSRPPVLWVLAADEAEARELLELDAGDATTP
ncbi:MAG: DUF2007 domain-containing protein [Gemmatimonadetes bacterium]|nr:DUF2007 domain-containing protein [Gemmatimonadota bacterium]